MFCDPTYTYAEFMSLIAFHCCDADNCAIIFLGEADFLNIYTFYTCSVHNFPF